MKIKICCEFNAQFLTQITMMHRNKFTEHAQ